MGELYLYFSVWYDNCHEIPSFSPLVNDKDEVKENDHASEEEEVKTEDEEISENDFIFNEKVTYEEYVQEILHTSTPSDDVGPGSRPRPSTGKDRGGVRVSSIQSRAGKGAGAKSPLGTRTGAKFPLGTKTGAKSPLGSPRKAWDSSESKGDQDQNGQEYDRNETSADKVRTFLSLYVFMYMYMFLPLFLFSHLCMSLSLLLYVRMYMACHYCCYFHFYPFHHHIMIR